MLPANKSGANKIGANKIGANKIGANGAERKLDGPMGHPCEGVHDVDLHRPETLGNKRVQYKTNLQVGRVGPGHVPIVSSDGGI